MKSVNLLLRSFYFYSILCYGVTSSQDDCAETKRSTATCVVTEHLPLDKDGRLNYRAMPSIGNGYLGTVIMSDEIHVSGVYNGKANVIPDETYTPKPPSRLQSSKRKLTGYYNHTHRARIPSPVSINFTTNSPNEHRIYILDMKKAIFVQTLEGSSYTVQQRSYAHRSYKNILVTEIQVETSVHLTLFLNVNMGPASLDLDLVSQSENDDFLCYTAQIRETETETSEKVMIGACYTKIPRSLTFNEGKFTETFFSVITSSLESSDPLQAAKDGYSFAQGNKQTLYKAHTEAWEQIWRTGNITVQNNLFLGQSIYSSFYNILSSMRDDWEHGLSPGSLPMGYEYLGHTFWDQDTWMFPPVLVFHPDYGKSLLNYRYNRLEAAMKIAEKYKFKGAMFPWESALSGFEVCPQEVYGRNEIHITGDISFAVNQYFQATDDLDWIRECGFDVLYQSALFWESRVTFDNGTGYYHINDVMPPDEYHYPVNDSVYTNVIAQNNLRLAIAFGKRLGKEVPEQWIKIGKLSKHLRVKIS